ncbi:MAG: hypothetical protein ACTHMR_09710 [Thermomicrobiales bacterium]
MAMLHATPGSAARGDPPPGWARWRWFLTIPALVIALLGLVGLALTARVQQPRAPSTPEAPVPVRFVAGPPLTERLIIMLLPGLDDHGLAAFETSLGGGVGGADTTLTVARPEFASFDEAAFLLLAGNLPPSGGDTGPTAPSAAPPDTLVQSLTTQNRAVALYGPPEWRKTFGQEAAEGPAPKVETVLNEGSDVLRTRGNSPDLTILYLKDVSFRDDTVRTPAGDLAPELAAFGSALGVRDTILLVGGGGPSGGPLHLLLGGAGVRTMHDRTLALNDVAPTCAVLLGTQLPAEARGNIVWPVLAVSERDKAEATMALARQRAQLAARVVPFGQPYPPLLKSAMLRFPTIETLVQDGQYAYAYQLASSSLDEANRAIGVLATAPAPLPTPRRASWPLVALGIVAALYALGYAVAQRRWGALAAAILGGVLGAATWYALSALARLALGATTPALAVPRVVPALLAGSAAAWVGYVMRGRRGGIRATVRAGAAVELLALFAALPAALYAYQSGVPWQLRFEETVPLFRWRAALLAPVLCLLAGYAWLVLSAVVQHARQRQASPIAAADSNDTAPGERL